METSSLKEISLYRDEHSDKVICVTASCFDLLHAGHTLMLKDGKSRCDLFVAFLQTDPTIDRPEKNKPILSFEERKILVEGSKYVDKVFIYSTEKELYNGLKTLNANIRILGNDYVGKQFTGCDLPMELYFHDRESHGWSTSALRKRIYNIELEKIKLKLN
jgi:glycerol-3-phosphate cytidylyltransferase